ncbi:hypothetical protein [Cesiribacter sp. SM1]|uniref:hypothetical protein n=1 Tax=Cesiribacter sp. SM1 TaxID=2861196 RepID=UPI001CD34441|nr:hypothetical protein [Cesiribacter sp. SM1]
MKSLFIHLFPLLTLLSACGAKYHEDLPVAGAKTEVKEALNQPEPAQENATSQHELSPFFLEGHEVLDIQKGDINNDRLDDVILIQKATDEVETSDVIDHPTPRPLMLLLRQPNGELQLAARNDYIVLCVDCGGMMGDPYQGTTIKNNYFSVEHYGGSAWRWSRIITFKYQSDSQHWYLHKDGGVSFHAANPDSTMEESVKTVKDFGVIRFEDYKTDEAE